jgi:hypothetical protein
MRIAIRMNHTLLHFGNYLKVPDAHLRRTEYWIFWVEEHPRILVMGLFNSVAEIRCCINTYSTTKK